MFINPVWEYQLHNGCAFDEDGTAIRELIVKYANDCGICDI